MNHEQDYLYFHQMKVFWVVGKFKLFWNYGFLKNICLSSEIGDQDRISQLLQADASIRAKACWFNVTCALGATAAKDFDDMDDEEKIEYNNLMRDLTNGNTDALNSAKDNMQFSSGLFNINF